MKKQNKIKEKVKEKFKVATHLEHWIELRNRLFICVISIVLAMCISTYFSNEIFDFIVTPLSEALKNNESLIKHGHKMIYTNLSEGFFTYMTMNFRIAIVIAFPIIAWQLYFFVAPGLYRSEQKLIIPYIFGAQILFLLGFLFVYYFVMPLAWQFFISFQNMTNSIPVVLEAKISEYLDIFTEFVLAFGFAFQLPIALLLLTQVGIIDSSTLRKYRRYAIVIIFIISAILTPPDVLSQIMLAIPLLMLYEFSIILCAKFK